jgi:hypothetical protein
MAQYTKSQLVSASNATYFTNTSGGISASAVRDLNDSWISSSALLSGSNTFIGNQIISGTLTAQLPANYIWLGDSNGYNQAVATSSISLQGAQGIQGLQGTQGTQGIQGITGLQGLQGLQGIQGLQGTQGIQGITGLQGIQGIEGASGSQGIQGLQGLQGIQGADNSTQGTQGIQGLQGLQGIQGITGISGSNGAQGIQGIQGIQGADNSTQGTQGIQGITGLQGITGISGSNGAQGTQGIQGVQGTDNSTQGAQGAQGIAGSAGSGSADTGSLLVTASFASTNITFTKGDATTFNLPGFATTGSNTFTGQQSFITTASPAITISGSGGFGYGIELTGGSGLKITGPGGPRLQFPNEMWLNGNESDNFQFTGDTDNPLTRGLDFFLYGTGSRQMQFRNNSGTSATMKFQTTTATGGNSIQFESVSGGIYINAGQGIQITGSTLQMQGFTYPTTDGTNGQVLTTNGSKTLTFTTVASSIDTGSFATTGSNTFYGSQTISGSVLPLNNFGGNLGSSGQNWTNLYVNEIQGLSNLRVDTIKFNGVTLPLASSQPRQLFGNGIDADTAMYYATSSANVNALRELAYVQSGSATTPDMNILSASFATTIASIVTGTGFATTGSNTFTGDQNILGSLTASLQQGYAWVGNSSNVSTLVATSSFGSGGTINTGSFATTGSNTFNGIETINIPTGGNAEGIILFNTGSDASGSMRLGITDPGNPFIKLKNQTWFQFGTGNQLQFESFTSSFDKGIIIGPYYTSSAKVHLMPRSSSLQFSQDIGAGEVPIFTLGTKDFSNPSQSIFETDLRVKGQFTASLQNGYIWVGGSGNVSTAANINQVGFATTGSNTFRGDQTISNSGNNNLYISSSTGGQSNILLQSPVGSNLTAYGQLNIGNNGGSGSIRVVVNSRDIELGADSGVAIGPVNISGNGVATGAIKLLAHSGSLILSNNSFTNNTGSLLHLSSSNNTTLANFIFKANVNTGTTIISGSGNIFTNPSNPNPGYIKYIGGNNNIYLQSGGGVSSQITASAASVSGARPTMNNNIFVNNNDFLINQAVNPVGTHTYSNNYNNGSTTINAMAFTGSLTYSSNINNNGSITINAASASNNEITGGFSGSHAITLQGNGIFGGQINQTTNRNQSTNVTNTISSNVMAGGNLSITNHSSSVGVNAQNNITNATINYSNAGAANLALHRSVATINQNYGAMTLIASASAISAQVNISPGGATVTNRMYSGSYGSGSLTFNNNSFGGSGNTYTVSGSYNGTAQGPNFTSNTIAGVNNTIFTNVEGRGNYVSFNGSLVGGSFLIMTGSNNSQLLEQGGAYLGRYNANDGIRNTSGENILVVGTGVSGSRKTGFLIDSGSNIYAEGTFNVSGSTAMTGSLVVSSFTTLASVSSSLNFADDTAAAAGGVPLGGLYRNGNFVMIRLT